MKEVGSSLETRSASRGKIALVPLQTPSLVTLGK